MKTTFTFIMVLIFIFKGFTQYNAEDIGQQNLKSVLTNCNYTFHLKDSYADGWNGATMQVKQDGVIIATLGSGFTQGTDFIQTISLTDGSVFELFWSSGGQWPSECGIKIYDVNDNLLYSLLPGYSNTGLIGTTLFSGVVNCALLSCPKPNDLTVSQVTQTSAELSWMEIGTASDWQIEYGVSGFTQGTGTFITSVSNPQYLGGLNPATNYQFYVRSNCTTEYSSWNGPFTFKTQCNPFTIPFFEDFETLAQCWRSENIDGNGEAWSFVNTLNHTPGGIYSAIHSFGTIGLFEEGIFMTPEIYFPSGIGVAMEFWSYNFDANLYGQNSVLVSTDNWNTYQVLWSPSSVSEQTWELTMLNLSMYAGNTVRIGFLYQGHTAHEWIIDDVYIYETPPQKSLTLNVLLESLYSHVTPGMMNKAQSDFGSHYPGDIADVITVEIRDGVNINTILYNNPNATLRTDGTCELIDIPTVLSGNYYIVIKHRNSIETWSATPVSFASSIAVNYSFISSAQQAFGNNLKSAGGGYYLIFGGDANQDGIVDGSDMSLIDNLSSLYATGYINEDINGDGIIDGSDMSIIENNSQNYIQTAKP